MLFFDDTDEDSEEMVLVATDYQVDICRVTIMDDHIYFAGEERHGGAAWYTEAISAYTLHKYLGDCSPP